MVASDHGRSVPTPDPVGKCWLRSPHQGTMWCSAIGGPSASNSVSASRGASMALDTTQTVGDPSRSPETMTSKQAVSKVLGT